MERVFDRCIFAHLRVPTIHDESPDRCLLVLGKYRWRAPSHWNRYIVIIAHLDSLVGLYPINCDTVLCYMWINFIKHISLNMSIINFIRYKGYIVKRDISVWAWCGLPNYAPWCWVPWNKFYVLSLTARNIFFEKNHAKIFDLGVSNLRNVRKTSFYRDFV